MSSCTGCATKFSVFRSEKSCPQCKFSFCSKCLSEKISLETPSFAGKQINVCKNCASKSRAKQQQSNYKNSEQLPFVNAVSSNSDNAIKKESKYANKPKSEDDKDDKIKQRLEGLRKDRMGEVISQTELEDRVAKLKGLDPEKSRAAAQISFRIPVDNRTQVEQSKDLLTQFTEEVAIDRKRPTAEEEIAARLAKLKDQPLPQSNQSAVDVDPSKFLASGSKDDDWTNKDLDDVDKLLQQYSTKFNNRAKNDLKSLNNDAEIETYMEKIKKRKKNTQTDGQNDVDEHSSSENDEKEAESELQRIKDIMKLEEENDNAELGAGSVATNEIDELPYCCICNEDAVLRCIDCDGDLYCKRCFREGHDKEDEHRAQPYKQKKHSD